MKITITLRELSDKCDWNKVCERLGLDYYCMQYSDENAVYNVSLEDLIYFQYTELYKLGLDKISI